jgi:mRNA-degrading endonuclease RelE of RelBE toxin-antitoxin system
MRSFTTERFRELYRALPDTVREQAREAYQRFKENPGHPGLQFKKVHPRKSVYSARVSRDYRVLGVLDNDEFVWFWIGSHEDNDKILTRL